jgi:hypothetical protein
MKAFLITELPEWPKLVIGEASRCALSLKHYVVVGDAS